MIARWTCKSLLRQPLSLLGSAAAIAAAYVLVMLFEAVWEGESQQLVSYIRRTEAEVWVLQKGVSNLHMASSLLPTWKADSVARVPGVAEVTPILYANTLVHAGGRNTFSYVVGLPPQAAQGGPWTMASGPATVQTGGAILPDMLARMLGVELGASIRIADRTFTVTALSAGTYAMVNPVVFVTAEDLSAVLSASGYDSVLLVKAAPGVAPRELAQAINAQVDKVSALTRADLMQGDYEMSLQMGVELIRLMSGMSAALAVLLVAFTLYTHMVRQRRELAIARALGFRQHHIYASVVMEALILSAMGFALAYLLALGGVFLTSLLAPQITMRLTAAILVKVGLGGGVVALLATLIPARQIARIDPQTAFQS